MIRRFAHTRLLWFVALLLLLAGLGSVARADTYTVTNADDDGLGTLRQAILDANAHPGPDIIIFNMDVGVSQTIQPLTPLPTLTDRVEINGKQPNDAPSIELDGSLLAVSDGDGLQVGASQCFLHDLVINRFGSAGIHLLPQTANTTVSNCYIGTDIGGTVALGSTYGIWMEQSNGNRVTLNVISGNGIGLLLNNASSLVQNNFIGTDVSGMVGVGNLIGAIVDGGSGSVFDTNYICASGAQGVILSGERPAIRLSATTSASMYCFCRLATARKAFMSRTAQTTAFKTTASAQTSRPALCWKALRQRGMWRRAIPSLPTLTAWKFAAGARTIPSAARRRRLEIISAATSRMA